MKRQVVTLDFNLWQEDPARHCEVAFCIGDKPTTANRFTVKIPDDSNFCKLSGYLRDEIRNNLSRLNYGDDSIQVGSYWTDPLVPYRLYVSIYTDLPLHVQVNIHVNKPVHLPLTNMGPS